MKKLVTLVSMFVLFAVGTAFSQGWTNLGAFPNDAYAGNGGHAVAVDPDGKVWMGNYYNVAGDTIFNGTAWVATRAIHVFNADGTPASFSPILTITVGGVTDSLIDMTNRGMRTNHEGNILVSTFDRLHLIDYKTGEGIAKVIPEPANGLTAAAVDGNGLVYTATVAPGFPIKIYSADLSSYLGIVTDASVGYSRSFEVSADGNKVYWAGYTNHKVYVYERPDEWSDYAITDSVFSGFDSESFCWSPDRTVLWASSGSYNDLPNRDPYSTTFWTVATWYAWDPVADAMVDSLATVFTIPEDAAQRPRGLAFSPDYRYAYVTWFSGTAFPVFQKYENPNWTSVDNEGQVVVNGYKLSQNYPNPFNPSTKISFELPNSGFVTLKVYDMLGREVEVLVDREMASGSHSVNFNAANLASGTYVYQLTSNGNVLTNKMVLLK